MKRSEWWKGDCPARGPALHHAHGTDCDCHKPFQCHHCEGYDPAAVAQHVDERGQPVMSAAPPVPLDVQHRLREMGMMPTPEPAAMDENEDAAPAVHEPETLVEPRAITGDGPQGNKWGLGRGELTPRQQLRVERFVEFHRRFGREGGTIES